MSNKLIWVLLLVCLSIALPVAANNADFILNQPEVDPASEVGFIRFAHTAVDIGAVDIYREELETPVVENLAYGEVTDFVTLGLSNKEYIVRRAGESEDIFRLRWGVDNNMSWLITVSGRNDRGALIMEPFNLIRVDIPEESASLRFINFVWGGPTLTLTADSGVTIASNTQYLNYGDTTLPDGEVVLSLSTGGGNVVAEKTVTLAPYLLYTVLALGDMDDAESYSLVVFESSPYLARARFTNERDEAIDIYAKTTNELLVENLAVGETSEYVTLPSHSETFIAHATGETRPDLAGGAVFLSPQRDFTYIVNQSGTITEAERLLTPVESSPDAEDSDPTQESG